MGVVQKCILSTRLKILEDQVHVEEIKTYSVGLQHGDENTV